MEHDPTNYAFASPYTHGLTKREYFAAAAMQGILGTDFQRGQLTRSGIAEDCVLFADGLLKALAETPDPNE